LWYADWAGGVLWLGTNDMDLHASAAKAGGHARLVRGNGVPFAPEPPARAALTRSVKAAFDPLGLFNPGRMYEGV
ncbi:MAG: hypothetical protein ACREHE_08185, partial [Rhizomicrobium sp.]